MSMAPQRNTAFFLQALLLTWFLSPTLVSAAQEVVADPPSRVGRLAHMEGEVTIAPAGTEDWAEAILNRPVTSGDRLWTDSDARAELQIGSAAAYLDEQTSFGVVELDDDVMQVSLTQGAATFHVRRLAQNETVRIETPNVAISLTQPGEYYIEVDAEADRTVVKTRQGVAEVIGDDQTHLVRADEQAVFSGLEDLQAQVQPLTPRSAFENWANDRERRDEQSSSAQYVSRDVVGYEDLDSHGDWYHEPEYGHVWRPRYVAYDWAPYRDGRWVWVSPWGWSWVDHAPWGFAPFHYGRWAHVRNRWCWVPGPRHYRPVYAPALVGWVGGPHVSVSVSFGSGIGWFPLGPREVYVPGYWHSPRYIRHVNASNTIIVNNTYITNVYAGRHRGFDYRYGRNPNAVTAIDRGQFIGGRPVLGRVLRVDERELRQWRHESRPPALTPDRASVLAGSTRRTPPIIRDQRDGRSARIATNRIAFDAERQHIEANGGRPIGRTHLYNGNPKEHGDFRRDQTRNEVVRSAPRQTERGAESVVRSFSDNQRLQSAPARESTNRFNTERGADVGQSRGRIENRNSDVAARALRGVENGRAIERSEDGSRSNRYQRDDARTASPRIEQGRAAPREQPSRPRTHGSPPSTPRLEQRSEPQRAEPRSAPPSERSESSSESRQQQQRSNTADRGSSAGRTHTESRGNSNSGRFHDR